MEGVSNAQGDSQIQNKVTKSHSLEDGNEKYQLDISYDNKSISFKLTQLAVFSTFVHVASLVLGTIVDLLDMNPKFYTNLTQLYNFFEQSIKLKRLTVKKAEGSIYLVVSKSDELGSIKEYKVPLEKEKMNSTELLNMLAEKVIEHEQKFKEKDAKIELLNKIFN